GLAFPAGVAAPNITPFEAIDLSWTTRTPHASPIDDIPYVGAIGRALLHAAAPVHITLVLVPIVGFVLYRTPLGMALRACGRNPDAISAQGRSVHALRLVANLVGAALVGTGGATLALTGPGAFSFALVSGRGFAAFALALIAGWRIGRSCFAVLAF